MGDDHDRAGREGAAGPKFIDIAAQVFGREDIKGAERFIHEQQRRLHHKGPGKTDPLAHAPRKLARIGLGAALQAHHGQGPQGPAPHLLLTQAPGLQAHGRVFQHREPGQ